MEEAVNTTGLVVMRPGHSIVRSRGNTQHSASEGYADASLVVGRANGVMIKR